MTEIINLRRARKSKMRAQKAAEAQTNRLRHGRSKTLTTLERARTQKAEDTFKAHRLDDDAAPEPQDKE